MPDLTLGVKYAILVIRWAEERLKPCRTLLGGGRKTGEGDWS